MDGAGHTFCDNTGLVGSRVAVLAPALLTVAKCEWVPHRDLPAGNTVQHKGHWLSPSFQAKAKSTHLQNPTSTVTTGSPMLSLGHVGPWNGLSIQLPPGFCTHAALPAISPRGGHALKPHGGRLLSLCPSSPPWDLSSPWSGHQLAAPQEAARGWATGARATPGRREGSELCLHTRPRKLLAH